MRLSGKEILIILFLAVLLAALSFFIPTPAAYPVKDSSEIVPLVGLVKFG